MLIAAMAFAMGKYRAHSDNARKASETTITVVCQIDSEYSNSLGHTKCAHMLHCLIALSLKWDLSRTIWLLHDIL